MKYVILAFACVAVAAAIRPITVVVAGEAGKGGPAGRILIVQSYNPEYVWTRQIDKGLRDALAGVAVDFGVVYLDAKRRPDPGLQRAAAQKVLARIEAEAPRVVVAVDDPAQAYLVAPFLKGRSSPQVVFCGVNAPLETYGYPAANVTGVRERYHFREGFELVKKIVPQAERVAFLGEDSESMRYVAGDLREDLLQNGPYALDLAGVDQCATFQEWQRKVRYYQKHADVLSFGPYNSLKDERTGRVADIDEVMAWTNAANTKPTLGFADIAKQHGALCGILESGHEQGLLAGAMVREILTTDKAAGRVPVEVNVKGLVLINLKTAERLGVRVPYEIIEAATEVIR
ncbi:MAG: ABC transporter substrate-binding protein [Thermodesulfobacteriota bacterium]